jgi:hypothetical protein
MHQRLIRYRTKPDQTAANEELVRAVYAELRHTSPEGLSYATFRLDDKVTFLHLVRTERDPNPLLAIRAFGDFQAGIADRWEDPPVQEPLTEIGSYRFFTS